MRVGVFPFFAISVLSGLVNRRASQFSCEHLYVRKLNLVFRMVADRCGIWFGQRGSDTYRMATVIRIGGNQFKCGRVVLVSRIFSITAFPFYIEMRMNHRLSVEYMLMRKKGNPPVVTGEYKHE